METNKFSVDFLFRSFVIIFAYTAIRTEGYPQQYISNPQQYPSHAKPGVFIPLHHESYTTEQRKVHEKPQVNLPNSSQSQTNRKPYQIKYDINGIPVMVHGNDGFATKHGDRAALQGEFPYKVQVRKNGEFLAAGTLVTSPITGKHVIITAMHVIYNATNSQLHPIQQLELVMGVIGKDAKDGQVRKIKVMLPHSEYGTLKDSHRPVFNDVAILIPERNFKENEFVKPIDLPSPDNTMGPLAGNYVRVKGWGKGREAGHDGLSSTMRVIDVPVWNSERCRMVYWKESGKDIITDNHFCAGYENGGMDTCQGDSGGDKKRLHFDEFEIYFARKKFNLGCGQPGYPGVYVKITKYMELMKKTLYNYEILGIMPPSVKGLKY